MHLRVVQICLNDSLKEMTKMDDSKVMSLKGIAIIGQHGREVGVVTDLDIDIETWQCQSLEVKLNRHALEDLKLKRPWFGTQTVRVPVSAISGATENLVLKCVLEELEFSGGQPAAVGSSPEQDSLDTSDGADQGSEPASQEGQAGGVSP
jgi:sporulation protein YlmC with PRC-barrel domain